MLDKMIPAGIEPALFWMSARCLRHWTTGPSMTADKSDSTVDDSASEASAVMTGFEPARTDRQSIMLPGYITSPFGVGRDGVEPPQSLDRWFTASLARQCMPTLVARRFNSRRRAQSDVQAADKQTLGHWCE